MSTVVLDKPHEKRETNQAVQPKNDKRYPWLDVVTVVDDNDHTKESLKHRHDSTSKCFPARSRKYVRRLTSQSIKVKRSSQGGHQPSLNIFGLVVRTRRYENSQEAPFGRARHRPEREFHTYNDDLSSPEVGGRFAALESVKDVGKAVLFSRDERSFVHF
eukprot:5937704-Amphidinium_carterae.1